MASLALRRPDRHHQNWQLSRLNFPTPSQIPCSSRQAQSTGSLGVVEGECQRRARAATKAEDLYYPIGKGAQFFQIDFVADPIPRRRYRLVYFKIHHCAFHSGQDEDVSFGLLGYTFSNPIP